MASVAAIAAYLNRRIHRMSLVAPGLTDDSLHSAVNNTRGAAMIVMEDVDALFDVHREKKESFTVLAEVYYHGPVAGGVDADPLLDYFGGVIDNPGKTIKHVVSVVGWGTGSQGKYWIVRNSWGTFWGGDGLLSSPPRRSAH